MPQIVAVALCSVLVAVCMFGGGTALNAAQSPDAGQSQSQSTQDPGTGGASQENASSVLGTSELVSEAGDSARAANLALAAQAIDGTVVERGGSFSLNDALSAVSARYQQTSEQAGADDAKPAPGVNQAASALYIASLKAGLDVTERHAGTAAAGYVSTGLEAVVSPGTADLKIMNALNSSAVVRATAQGQKITVNIVGTPADSSVKYDVVARIVDGNVDSEYTVESYLVSYKDGVKSSEKKLAESVYTGSADAGASGNADDAADGGAEKSGAADSAASGSKSNSGGASQGNSDANAGKGADSGASASGSGSSSTGSTNPVPSRGGTSPVK